MRNTPDQRYPRTCTRCEGEGKLCSNPDNFPDISCNVCGGKKITFLTPREALQKLGTEWGRDCYEDTWVDLAVRNARKILPGSEGRYRYSAKEGVVKEREPMPPLSGVAIPDVRFWNEVRGLRKQGAKLIRVKRLGKPLELERGIE